MTTPTTRQLIVEWFRTRLLRITVENGFATNAGQNVVFGGIPDMPPEESGGPSTAIAVVIGNDNPVWQGASLLLRLPIVVHAIATASSSESWVAVEAILADIKRAIEVEDRTLGGLLPRELERGSTNTVEHPAESMTVGLSIEYVAAYREAWGQPEA